MVVDLAVPATPPIASASAQATSESIAAKEGDNPLESGVDTPTSIGEVYAVRTAPPFSKDDPGNGRAGIDRDNDITNGSDYPSSVSASAAGDSPENTDSKAHLRASQEGPSSSIDGSEALDEACSGGERANEGGRTRCVSVKSPGASPVSGSFLYAMWRGM